MFKQNLALDLSFLDGLAHTPSVLSLQKKAGGRELRDYCIPVNPYFPTPAFMDKIRGRLDRVLKFYPSSNLEIAENLSGVLGVPAENLVMGNGSNELITWIDHLWIKDALVTSVPTFGRWTDQPRETGKAVHHFQRREERSFRIDVDEFIAYVRESGARAVAISNPNNPTGQILSKTDVIRLMDAFEDLDLFVVDESFIDFSDIKVPTVIHEAIGRRNVVVLKSLGKNFGLHGVRFGLAAANQKLSCELRQTIPQWNINGLAEAIIQELPNFWGDYEESRRKVLVDRVYAEKKLEKLPGFRVFPTQSNFHYLKLPRGVDGVELRNRLIEEAGFLTRECGNKIGSTRQFMRIATRPIHETDELVAQLQNIHLQAN